MDSNNIPQLNTKKPTQLEIIAHSLKLITKGRPVIEVMAELRKKNRRFKMI